MSKERRVDPQITVGLLVNLAEFSLEIHCFEGNAAETCTLLLTLTAFQEPHGITDGQLLESVRRMDTRKAGRDRQAVYQWLFKRQKHDDRAINAMVTRAEKITDGSRPLTKDRFVKLTSTPGVDWDLVEQARQLAGLKDYVTNLVPQKMTGAEVIAAYHDLRQVKKSSQTAKTDLRARPIFRHQRITTAPKSSTNAHAILNPFPQPTLRSTKPAQTRPKPLSFRICQ